jgi:hypothetical protein
MPRRPAEEKLDALLRAGDPAERQPAETESRWRTLEAQLTDDARNVRRPVRAVPVLALLGTTALLIGVGKALWPRPAPPVQLARVVPSPMPRAVRAELPRVPDAVVVARATPIKPQKRVRRARRTTVARVARAERREPRRTVHRRRFPRRHMPRRPVQNPEFVERIIIDCSSPPPPPTATVAIIGTGESLRVIKTINSSNEEKS